MPAHIVLERAHVRHPVEGEPFTVRWAMVNAGDSQALVTAWCVYVVACDVAEARADTPPPAPGRVSFSEGRLRLQPQEVFQRQDPGGTMPWCECPDPGRELYFVASVEYTDDSRAFRRTHCVQALRPGDPHVHQCHFASLST